MKSLCFCGAVFLVVHHDFATFRHRLHDACKVCVTGRDVLHRNPARKTFLAEGQDVVHCERVYQPCHFCILVCNVLGIAHIIAVCASVALDPDAEDLLHRLTMVVECAAGIGRVEPFLPSVFYLAKAQSVLSCADESLHQPDVFLQ